MAYTLPTAPTYQKAMTQTTVQPSDPYLTPTALPTPQAPAPQPATSQPASYPQPTSASAPSTATTQTATNPVQEVYNQIPVGASYTPQQALDLLAGVVGRPLTPEEIQQAIQISGYSGSGPVSEGQMRLLLEEAARRLGLGQIGDARAIPVSPTSPTGQDPIDPGGLAIPVPPGGGITPTGGTPTGPTGLIPAPGAPLPTDPMRTAGQNALLQLLQQLQQPVSLDDPNLRTAADVFRSAQQRSTERQRQALSERMFAEGTNTGGGLTTGLLGIEADAGNRTAAFESDLVLSEMRDRRQQLLQAISMAEQAGQFSIAQQMQRELSLLDLALRERLGMGDLALRERLGLGDLGLRGQSLDLQRLLGGGDLALRRDALGQQGTLARLNALLQLYGLGLQNDQFNTRTGFDYTQLQALLNRWATEALL